MTGIVQLLRGAGVSTLITPRESIELPQENKYRRTFNIAHSRNLFTAVAFFFFALYIRLHSGIEAFLEISPASCSGSPHITYE